MILPIRCCCDPWLVLGTIDNVTGDLLEKLGYRTMSYPTVDVTVVGGLFTVRK